MFFNNRCNKFLRPIRSQFYVQFDLNYTSNSISIIRPIRPQLYVQFDLNYTSNSTSIIPPYRVATFFCRRYGAGGTWNSHSRQYNASQLHRSREVPLGAGTHGRLLDVRRTSGERPTDVPRTSVGRPSDVRRASHRRAVGRPVRRQADV